MESIPFQWGYNGPNWKINDKNGEEIKLTATGWNSIYSVDTFNSTQYKRIQFELKIKKRSCNMLIGIINNFQHANTKFCINEIVTNNESKIDQNMYYCIDADDGTKESHTKNHISYSSSDSDNS